MKLKIILLIIVLAWLMMPLAPALAQASLTNQSTDILNTIGERSGYGSAGEVTEATIAQKAGNVIGLVLGFLGVVFLFLVVYSGVQWMTAGGNEEKITKARNRMIQAAIGVAIIAMAYALTNFVVRSLQGAKLPTEVLCVDMSGAFCTLSIDCAGEQLSDLGPFDCDPEGQGDFTCCVRLRGGGN
ncbi:MAG TPA: pilin [Patescibacteria group bacterium]|nr:pilin [Patescibacteria group bacterium]